MKTSDSLLRELNQTISQYLEQHSQPNDGQPTPQQQQTFDLAASITPNGDVSISIKWPTNVPDEAKVNILSSMLYQVTTGMWNPMLIRAMQQAGIAQDQMGVAHMAIAQWGGMQRESSSDTLCVPPDKVFSKGEE